MSNSGYGGQGGYGGNDPNDPNRGWSQPAQPQGPPYGQPYEPTGPQYPYGSGDTQQYPPAQDPYNQQYGQQYGQPGGDPAYGAPGQYGPPGQYGGPGYGAPPPGGKQNNNKALLWGILAAVVVAGLAVGGYFLFAGDDKSGGKPADPVRALFDAGKANDLAAARKTLCAADRSSSIADNLDRNGRVSSYSIGSTSQADSTHATVRATATIGGRTTSTSIPVLKEDGSWKVCFSSGGLSTPSAGPSASGLRPSSFPSGGVSVPSFPSITVPSITVPSITAPSIAVPTGGVSFSVCSGATTAAQAARVYISAAEIGSTDLAQGCIYQNRVSRSVTESIHATGEYFLLDPTAQTGPVFRFKSVTTSKRLSVTIAKESDGKYWVTAVSAS